MKTQIFQLSLLCLAAAGISACNLDNYDQPSSTLSGKVTDRDGNPIGVQGARGNVSLQLWQPSYPLHADAINITVAQDGSFSALLFDGEYVLKLRDGNGPWVNSKDDTLAINISGGKSVVFPVTPYYTISDVAYSLAGTTLTATFTVNEVTNGRKIDEIALLVNTTSFVDFEDNDVKEKVAEQSPITSADTVMPGRKTLVIDLADMWNNPQKPKLYARVGLRIAGIGQGLYDTQVYTVK